MQCNLNYKVDQILTSRCPPLLHPGVAPGVVVAEEEEKKRCAGLGLFYGLVSTILFSIIALLVKTIEGMHSIEISATRCFFQMVFVVPLLIYHR